MGRSVNENGRMEIFGFFFPLFCILKVFNGSFDRINRRLEIFEDVETKLIDYAFL